MSFLYEVFLLIKTLLSLFMVENTFFDLLFLNPKAFALKANSRAFSGITSIWMRLIWINTDSYLGSTFLHIGHSIFILFLYFLMQKYLFF
nr:MAG TPA: hypothetical protein [Caudoviricetes sp.]